MLSPLSGLHRTKYARSSARTPTWIQPRSDSRTLLYPESASAWPLACTSSPLTRGATCGGLGACVGQRRARCGQGNVGNWRSPPKSRANVRCHGFPPGRVEGKSGVSGGGHVQRAIELASPGEMVCGGGAGTSVSQLHRNNPGIRESNEERKTAGDEAIHGASRTVLRDRGIGLHALGT